MQAGEPAPGVPDHLVASNKYGKYCVPLASRHRSAAAVILAGKIWEPRTIDYMLAHCGSGDVVHAGTYFGDFLPALSNGLGQTARLWAFEPSLENYTCAAETIRLNGLQNVTLFHNGLDASLGTGTLRVGVANELKSGGTARIVRRKRMDHQYEEVRMVALDEIIPKDRNVSIIQLDVEGFEQNALTGALRTIGRCKPALILENPPKDLRWFETEILARGYRETAKVHANTVFVADAKY